MGVLNFVINFVNFGHPAVVRSWLETHANKSFNFDPDHKMNSRERKHKMLGKLERKFGWDFSKRHFKIIKEYTR